MKEKETDMPEFDMSELDIPEFVDYLYPSDIVRIFDIEKERKKPVFVSVEEFAEKIQQYDIDAFLNTNEMAEASPYRDLLLASRMQAGLYDQYASVIRDIVKQKADENSKETLNNTSDIRTSEI